jgi:hypothetical protein
MEVNPPQNTPLASRFPHPLFWNKGSQVHIIFVLNEKQKLDALGGKTGSLANWLIKLGTFCWCKTVVGSQHSQPPANQTWTKQNRSKTWQPFSGGFFSLFISQDSLTKLHGQRPMKDPIWRPWGSHRLLFPTFSGPNRVRRMCRFLDTIRLLLNSAFTRWQCQLTT